MSSTFRIVGSARPNFLVLAPICVALGMAVAHYRIGEVHWLHTALIILGAVLAHASVNFLNEYEDFDNGLDAMTQRTPFSGGSGTLQAYPQLAGSVRAAGLVTLVGTAGIGVYFLATVGLGLLPVGLLGVVLVASYSTWIVRRPLLCLVAPGLGFGPAMVMGTEYVLTGGYSVLGFAASLVPLFLVSGLLLLNQFPDREPDEKVGRRNVAITLERSGAAHVYAALLVATLAVIVAGLASGLFPAPAALALLAIVPVAVLVVNVERHAESVPKLLPMMGLNVLTTMLTPALLAAGLFLA